MITASVFFRSSKCSNFSIQRIFQVTQNVRTIHTICTAFFLSRKKAKGHHSLSTDLEFYCDMDDKKRDTQSLQRIWTTFPSYQTHHFTTFNSFQRNVLSAHSENPLTGSCLRMESIRTLPKAFRNRTLSDLCRFTPLIHVSAQPTIQDKNTVVPSCCSFRQEISLAGNKLS